ncbi:hypothetical protein GOODEAATRI_003734 [Goodea atripinnis]|uniref:Uncharacterized protein n=1 Tax=Goodea atripinnis TaxID=208336 RepID=A0ABV0PVF8_9TELE
MNKTIVSQTQTVKRESCKNNDLCPVRMWFLDWTLEYRQAGSSAVIRRASVNKVKTSSHAQSGGGKNEQKQSKTWTDLKWRNSIHLQGVNEIEIIDNNDNKEDLKSNKEMLKNKSKRKTKPKHF